MRISVNINDPGYNEDAAFCHVYLDGKKIDNCFTADEELGIAYCYKVDDKENIILDRESGKPIETERHGKVRIAIEWHSLVY